ncbi:uncharacterized protein AKAW2_10362S [Aspergillus luchuensis]|uniref:Uncharacterized protein n=1 Tax=Aspergillus kawachii TaxID=1069201 RepID=A0A7R7VYZ8_ASPKA|nr:uncharacterized protein AKAW2_10362S [Aspergillus luchuensis]BCR93316.1 hypothetical protein AKAW2_10362S [Aspergillus luchuensis]
MARMITIETNYRIGELRATTTTLEMKLAYSACPELRVASSTVSSGGEPLWVSRAGGTSILRLHKVANLAYERR